MKIVYLIVLTSLIISCGQFGKLYLPDNQRELLPDNETTMVTNAHENP